MARKSVLTKAVNEYWWKTTHRGTARKARTSARGWFGTWESSNPPWFVARRAHQVKRRKRI